jgi:predicted GH43/DUF377 family glycosyl hydrolase
MKKWHLFIQPGRWIILRILILLLPSSFLIAQENVFHIASKKQLFIDDQLVASEDGVKWQVNSPRKAGPVITPVPEKEGPRIATKSILQVGDEYWMYYTLYAPVAWLQKKWRGEVPNYIRKMTCLAKSRDGIQWEQINAGLFDIGNGKDNAIVMPVTHGTIFIDPHKTRGSRFWFIGNITENPWWEDSKGAVYKLFDDTGEKVGGAMYLCHSKDGIHWERIKEPILPIWCDTQNQAFYDPYHKKYVAYVRGRVNGLRSVCRGESEQLDQLPWSYEIKPETDVGPGGMIPRMNAEELPAVIKPDTIDPEQTDIYTPNVHIYPYADSRVYLAFLPVYRHYPKDFQSYGRDTRGQYKNDGPVEMQLAVSRDGIQWKRYHDPYISLGRMDETDGGTVYMGVGMIRQGDEIWQYYTGSPWTHGSKHYQPELSNAIIRTVQRLDGFVSVDAGHSGGELITHPLVFEGNRLQLNIDCGAMGEAWVEIQDVAGNPIPNYSMDDCVSVDRNGVAQEVWWKNGPDVSEISGQPVRLRVKMRSSKLYAFQFIAKK